MWRYLILILLELVSGVLSEPLNCTVSFNASQSVTPISCNASLYRDNACWLTELENNDIYGNYFGQTLFVSKPKAFDVEPFFKQKFLLDLNSSTLTYKYVAAVNLCLHPPSDTSKSDTKGFLVNISRKSGDENAIACVIIEILNGPLSHSHGKANITFNVAVPLTQNSDFVFAAKSLPMKDWDENSLQTYLTTGKYMNGSVEMYKWTSLIAYRTKNQFKTSSFSSIDVWYARMPQHWERDITGYQLQLKSVNSADGSFTNIQTVYLPKTSWHHQFQEIKSPGVYVVKLLPVNTSTSGSACYDSRGTTKPCTESVSDCIFLLDEGQTILPSSCERKLPSTSPNPSSPTLKPEPDSTLSSQQQKTTDSDQVPKMPTIKEDDSGIMTISIFIVAGIVLFCALIVVAVFQYKHRDKPYLQRLYQNIKQVFGHGSGQSLERETANNKFSGIANPSMQIEEKPEECKMLVLNADDSPGHVNAVESFCNLLQQHCNFTVLYNSGFPRKTKDNGEWLEGCIQNADQVVIITSQKVFHLYELWKNKTFDRSKSEFFLQAFQTLSKYMAEFPAYYKKVVIVSFPYTKKEHFLQDLRVAERFQLNAMFDEFLQHIICAQKQSNKCRNVKCDSLLNTPEGEKYELELKKMMCEMIKPISKGNICHNRERFNILKKDRPLLEKEVWEKRQDEIIKALVKEENEKIPASNNVANGRELSHNGSFVTLFRCPLMSDKSADSHVQNFGNSALKSEEENSLDCNTTPCECTDCGGSRSKQDSYIQGSTNIAGTKNSIPKDTQSQNCLSTETNVIGCNTKVWEIQCNLGSSKSDNSDNFSFLPPSEDGDATSMACDEGILQLNEQNNRIWEQDLQREQSMNSDNDAEKPVAWPQEGYPLQPCAENSRGTWDENDISSECPSEDSIVDMSAFSDFEIDNLDSNCLENNFENNREGVEHSAKETEDTKSVGGVSI